MRARLLLGVPGALVAAYGLWLLLRTGWDNLWATAIWLGGGVVVHDLLFVPLVLLACAVLGRLLPERVRRPALVGAIVLGAVTIATVPTLGRFGARPDNPTLLDRDYATGWLVVAGLTLVGVLVAVARTAAAARRTGSRSDPA